MRILVVDDEPTKRATIVGCLLERDPSIVVDEAASFESATTALRDGEFDWVVLDMRISTYDTSPTERGGRPRNLGGEELLRKMSRRGQTARVVVVTQYSVFREQDRVITHEDLLERLHNKYDGFVGLVQLRHSSDEWRHSLLKYIFGAQDDPDR